MFFGYSLLTCPPLTSCCAAWLLTGQGPVPVCSLGPEDPCTRGPFYSHPCQYFFFCQFIDGSHPEGCEVTSHCGFNLHLSDN